MVKAHSLDLRERIVARVLAGDSVRRVSATFSVSVASVVRWSQRQRLRGHIMPDKMGGHRTHLLDDHRTWLLGRIDEESDVTLRDLKSELLDLGISVSYGTVWNFVHREDLSFKKKRSSQRARSPKGRAIPGALGKISKAA